MPRRSDTLEARATAVPHDHAVLPYAHESAMLESLLRFVDEGVERDEVTVFVHSFGDDEDAWRRLEARRPDVRRLAESSLVLVSRYTLAFERDGRIDHDHVTSVVTSLLDGAAADGRGLRIFVDASRRYIEAGRDHEWFAFESWLGKRLKQAVALVCAYPASVAEDLAHIENILRTHAYRFSPPKTKA